MTVREGKIVLPGESSKEKVRWNLSNASIFLKRTLQCDHPNASTVLGILHMLTFSCNLIYLIQSTLQHFHMPYLHNCMKYYYPHLTGKGTSTERLSDLPEITQLVGRRARIRTRLTGARGHLAKLPLEAHALSPVQWKAQMPETLPCSGFLLRPGAAVLWRKE